MNEHSTGVAWAKVAVAWIGALIGTVTLSQIAVVLTIVFTLLQIYMLIRGVRRDARLEKLEARLRQGDPK